MRHDTLINCFKVKCVIQLCLCFVNLFLLKYAHKNSNLLSAFLWLFQVTCKKTPEQCSHNDHVIWIFQSSLVFVIRIKIIKIRGSSIYFILTCDLPLLFSIFKLLWDVIHIMKCVAFCSPDYLQLLVCCMPVQEGSNVMRTTCLKLSTVLQISSNTFINRTKDSSECHL